MKVQKFEDLIAWQKSQDLAVMVYNKFRNHKDFGFKNQICRAVVSISNNIAEGFERRTRKDFIRFLNISQGSTSEVKSMLHLAHRLDYISKNEKNELIPKTIEVSKILNGLIKSLETK